MVHDGNTGRLFYSAIHTLSQEVTEEEQLVRQAQQVSQGHTITSVYSGNSSGSAPNRLQALFPGQGKREGKGQRKGDLQLKRRIDDYEKQGHDVTNFRLELKQATELWQGGQVKEAREGFARLDRDLPQLQESKQSLEQQQLQPPPSRMQQSPQQQQPSQGRDVPWGR